MSRITGGTSLVRSLVSQGVSHVFTLCGNHLLSAYDATIDYNSAHPREPLNLIDVRHESSAAHMADAWTRVTGRPGVCLVTGGPGHTNAITGVATAYAADSPIVWISGASEHANHGQGAMQELDQVGLAGPITKWSHNVTDVRQIPQAVARAFQIAQTGRPGPVHLSIPVDIMDASADESDVQIRPHQNWKMIARTPGRLDSIESALDLLNGAKRPVIVAGSGAWWSDAGRELQAFIEATNIPLFTIDTARGLVSDDHPLCFGYADPLLNPAAQLFDRADVVLLLGRRLDFRLRYGQVFAPGAAIIQVDAEPTDLGRNRNLAVGIVGNVASVLDGMRFSAEAREWSDHNSWLDNLSMARENVRQERMASETSDATPLHPLRIVREVREMLGDDYCLSFDAGDFVQWARQALPARRPGSWLRLGPMATLGCAIPFAIAAKLARPSARVFALTGDGGVGFYGFELDTAARHNIPIVTVVANDAAWGMEKNLQRGIYGEDRVIASELRPTRYDLVAQALGCYSENVTTPGELRPALERSLRSKRPSLVNVQTACLPSSLTEASVRRKIARR